MSLILCRQEPVTNPYYIEELGIHLHSSQELCYVIYHHPLLVMEDFVDTHLTGFIRGQLRMPFLAERLEKWLESRGASDELLFLILQDCFYYSTQEQAKFRQEVLTLRKLPREEYEKRRADYFYGLQLYGKAVSLYEKLLNGNPEASFKGKLWNNIAACYTKLFCYQKALYAYECACEAELLPEYVKRMYLLTLMAPELTLKEKYLETISEDDRKNWAQEAQEVKAGFAESSEALALQALFEKDPVKRLTGASELLNRWKLEYRRMI